MKITDNIEIKKTGVYFKGSIINDIAVIDTTQNYSFVNKKVNKICRIYLYDVGVIPDDVLRELKESSYDVIINKHRSNYIIRKQKPSKITIGRKKTKKR